MPSRAPTAKNSDELEQILFRLSVERDRLIEQDSALRYDGVGERDPIRRQIRERIREIDNTYNTARRQWQSLDRMNNASHYYPN
jgi:hypothetical protein